MAERALRVVDDQGQVHDSCPGCVKLEHEITVLQKKMRGMARELGEALADRQAEAEADELWPLALRVFRYHQALCRHPRAQWTAERFAMLRKVLASPDGLEGALRAIAGCWGDAWRRERGLTMFEDIFESRKKFERCLAACPNSWCPPRGSEGLLG